MGGERTALARTSTSLEGLDLRSISPPVGTTSGSWPITTLGMATTKTYWIHGCRSRMYLGEEGGGGEEGEVADSLASSALKQ